MQWARSFRCRPGAATHLLLFNRHQSRSDGESHQPGHVVNIQSLHQLGSVGLDCLDADAQNSGDILGAVAFCNQLQDLTLTRSQPLDPGTVSAETPLPVPVDTCGDQRTEVLLTTRDGCDCALQLGGGAAFHQIPGSSGIDCIVYVLLI